MVEIAPVWRTLRLPIGPSRTMLLPISSDAHDEVFVDRVQFQLAEAWISVPNPMLQNR